MKPNKHWGCANISFVIKYKIHDSKYVIDFKILLYIPIIVRFDSVNNGSLVWNKSSCFILPGTLTFSSSGSKTTGGVYT